MRRKHLPLEDIHAFAVSYAAAWCSQRSNIVAEHFTVDGILTINSNPPAIGREAIAASARSFMDAFPDLVVRFDKLVPIGPITEFHWTLVGTNTGPGGAGHTIRISGFELWKLKSESPNPARSELQPSIAALPNARVQIEQSVGSFDELEFERQMRDGR